MHSRIAMISFCVVLLFLSTSYGEERGPITQTYTPVGDTFIKQYSPNTNHGGEPLMLLRNKDGGSPIWAWDILVNFDYSNIEKNSQVIKATLRLYYYAYVNKNPYKDVLKLYKITQAWDEMQVTWNTRPSKGSTITSTKAPASPGQWIEWDVTQDVQLVVDGGADNYGWYLVDATDFGGFNIPYLKFRTKEHGSFVPELVIEYDSPLTLNADKHEISQNGVEKVNFFLTAGAAHAYRQYILLMSITGTSPGIPLPGGLVTLPLNWDGAMRWSLDYPNSIWFQNFQGMLDGNGDGAATFNPNGLLAGMAGLEMYFAYALIPLSGPWDFVSNPVTVTVTN